VIYIKDRIGNYFETYTGKKFYPLDPKPEEIDIRDIAHALSLICKFGGHCPKFYSIAQHSIYLSTELRKLGYNSTMQLYGLLYNASETYVGSIPRSVKISLSGYLFTEKNIQNAIWRTFKLYIPTEKDHVIIKEVINNLLIHEREQLMGNFNDWKRKVYTKLDFKINIMPNYEVEKAFIDLYCELRFPLLKKSDYKEGVFN